MTMDQLIASLTALREKHGNIRVDLLAHGGMALVTPYVHYVRDSEKGADVRIRIEPAKQQHQMEFGRRAE